VRGILKKTRQIKNKKRRTIPADLVIFLYIDTSMFIKEFEDTKGVIKIRISMKNRQNKGQKKKEKQRSTKHTHKTKDLVTRTPPGVNSGAPEG